jgi:uncharacterized protein YuzE
MKIRYLPDTYILYIELADRVSSSSEAVSDTSTIETILPISPAHQPA